ncbi:MAG TPA: hypothetical protein VGM19_08185 [Armatimonadota bacterium]|jgi:hypothetical protein
MIALLIAAVCGSFAAASAAPATVQANLRQLGKITATTHATALAGAAWITLTAEDPAKARACGSKLLADLLGFGDVQRVPASSLPGTRLALAGAGEWLLALDGLRVQVLFARDVRGVTQLAAEAKAAGWAPVPEHAYPRFLDRFDNDAFSVGFLGWGILPPDVNADFQWIADNGFAMNASGFQEDRMIAPGVFDFSVFDWYAAKAKEHNLAYNVYLTWVHPWERAKWSWNVVPLPHLIPGDHAVPYSDFFYQQLETYTGFFPVKATDPLLGAAQAGIAAHLAQDPRLNSQFGSAELLHDILLALPEVSGMPETKAGWHEYQRTKLGRDLAAVGKAYRDEPAAYASWDQVEVPDLKLFAGWDRATCLDLRGAWESKVDRAKVGVSEKWFAPETAAAGWTATRSDDPMIMAYSSTWRDQPRDFWLRKQFTVSAPQAAGKLPYLHISLGDQRRGFEAYLNGQPLKKLTREHPIVGDNDQCFEIGAALRTGENLLVLNTHGVPVSSYVFLGPQGRWEYPSPRPTLNRLWFDATEFTAWWRMRSLENALRANRSGDPQGRPQLVMCPDDFQDMALDLCRKYGAFEHDTGQTAGCWAPWPTRYSAARGLPFSSEPGNAPNNAPEMQKMITLYLLLGNDSINALFHPTQYRDNPDIAAWIATNRELLRCAGKMEQAPPPVSVLRSIRDASRLRFDGPWGWDLGRGELQSVGRTFYYADMPDVLSGRLLQRAKVTIDAGSELLTEPEVSGLEKYVREGGVFVALHNTGKHSIEQAASWPISRLTGLRVVNQDRAVGGKIRFTQEQSLWPSLRGREINAWGMVYDWRKEDLTGNSLGLEKQDPSVQVVAEWVGREPGSGQIAVAVRKLGQGMVITLGSTFWRNAEDLGGRWTADAASRPYLAELLDSLGVPADSTRESSAATADLFAEHWLSKNGLYDLYMVSKVKDGATPATFPITFTATAPPAQLREISALGHPLVPTQAAGTGFAVPDVTLNAMQTRIYAAPRADLATAPLYWLRSLEKRWYALDSVPPADQPVPMKPSPYVLPLIEGWSLQPGGEPWGDTPPPYATDATTPPVKLGSFAALGLADDSIAHFRKEVQLPAGWQGRRLSLVLDCEDWIWGVQPKGRLWVDGKLLTAAHIGQRNDPRFSADIVPTRADGRLLLELEVDGRQPAAQQRRRPTGVLGAFYLQSDPQPVSLTPLPQPWQVAADLGVFAPGQPGQRVKGLYAETSFILPATWPTPRVFLESPESLGFLILNDTVVSTPTYMRRLDISGLVHRDGTPNVLRWSPGAPSANGNFDQELPRLSLAWWPAGN